MPEFYENEEYGHGVLPLGDQRLNSKQFGQYSVYHSLVLPGSYGSMNDHTYHELHLRDEDGDQVGRLEWSKRTGKILAVDVTQEFRRQGLATALLGHARRLSAKYGIKAPVHSNDRTDAGEAWARSLGERLPKRISSADFPNLNER